jgi:sulfite exporter TauE/SafE
LPYYVGKAIAYAILGLIVYLFSKQLSDIAFFRNTALVILIVTGILFFQAAFFKTFTFIKLGWFNTLITRATSKLQLSTYGFKGLLLGMILGLIPCGLVYGGIITAAAYSENAVVMILAMLSFGLATTPGLFISAYFGSIVLIRFKKAFNILYVIMMILNGSLLMRYALKLI